jgi:inosose dehydratase
MHPYLRLEWVNGIMSYEEILLFTQAEKLCEKGGDAPLSPSSSITKTVKRNHYSDLAQNFLEQIVMRVALHSAPVDFFKLKPPYPNSELLRLVRKAASLGFKSFQIGPLWTFDKIEPKELKRTLDSCGLEANVHVGGLYDAAKFATTEEEYLKVEHEIHTGIELCGAISSRLVSIHPPFFVTKELESSTALLKARDRFSELVSRELEAASDMGIKVALESFCYHPFIFDGLHDFMQFVARFSSNKLGVLLETGHLFNTGFDSDDAVSMFKNVLFDVHIHDAKARKDFAEATHLPIGLGDMDFAHLIKRLREVGYDGWLTLEIDGNEKQIIENRLFLEKLLEKTR